MKHSCSWIGNSNNKSGRAEVRFSGRTISFDMDSFKKFNDLACLLDEISLESFRTGKQAMADTIVAIVQKSLI